MLDTVYIDGGVQCDHEGAVTNRCKFRARETVTFYHKDTDKNSVLKLCYLHAERYREMFAPIVLTRG